MIIRDVVQPSNGKKIHRIMRRTHSLSHLRAHDRIVPRVVVLPYVIGTELITIRAVVLDPTVVIVVVATANVAVTVVVLEAIAAVVVVVTASVAIADEALVMIEVLKKTLRTLWLKYRS